MDATTSFDARVVVTTGGQAFGGSLSVPVTSEPQYWSWNDPSGYGHRSFTAIYGYASGRTTP